MENETSLPGSEFTVSHTEYKNVVEACNLREILGALPEGSVVVDIGSGLNQEFARGLEIEYPKLKTLSIDPTLAIGPESTTWKVYETGSFLDFNQYNGQSVAPIQKQRLENLGGDIAIAADAINLPLADNSADLVVDNSGPGLYFTGTELEKYLNEIYRVLKPGGEAHISSFLRLTGAGNDPLGWKEKSITELRMVLTGIVPIEDLEFFHNEGNTGLIIKKSSQHRFVR